MLFCAKDVFEEQATEGDLSEHKTVNRSELLSIENVSYVYDDGGVEHLALSSVDLKIKKGEFVCLLGPSGCGKSTLLNIIAGYLKPTEGAAYLGDKLINGPSKDRGVLFQSPALYPWLSVIQNVMFGPSLRNMPEKDCREMSEKLLSEVGLSGFADARTFDLSGGMMQRAMFATVLANQPKVVLMDEPFGALDALTRLKMQALSRRLWLEQKSTVFMITHDIDEALSLATRVLVMTEVPGKIEEEIKVKYTYAAVDAPNGRVHMDMEYIAHKEHILDLIE